MKTDILLVFEVNTSVSDSVSFKLLQNFDFERGVLGVG